MSDFDQHTTEHPHGTEPAADENPAAERNSAPDTAPPVTQPSARIRVHALAKELGTTSKAVIAELEGLGDARRSASAVLSPEVADQVRARIAAAGEASDDAAGSAASIEATPEASDGPASTALIPTLSHSNDDITPIADPEEPAQVAATALFVAPQADVVQPRRAKKAPVKDDTADTPDAAAETDSADAAAETDSAESPGRRDDAADPDDDQSGTNRRRRRGRRGRGRKDDVDSADSSADDSDSSDSDKPDKADDAGANGAGGSGKGKQGNRRGKNDSEADSKKQGSAGGPDAKNDDDQSDDESGGSSRRRRRRRRRGDGGGDGNTDSGSGSKNDEVRGVSGSVRLEAKRQRRKEGRDAGRRRAPILTEAQFLARREAVTRRMIVRQRGERTQIAVLEDDVLVEHYVTLATEQSFAGSIFFGRVQNVLPSMEAAFVDIGKRRNAVLYAGEVNWDAAGLEGKQRSIEQAMKSGDKLLVQVTKDPIGHKGARLTSQISLPGRYLVYVPGGSMTGISRKLPDAERQRLKEILRRIVPDEAGVIIRTAAEGASEEELTRDVNRLKAQWEVIEKKAADSKTQATSMLYEEPDLAIRVVRDLFNEDFSSMEISGDEAWETISAYVQHVAPDLAERVTKYDGDDVFEANRVDEQLTKALDRKVWLPSGGSLVIDHTEAMTVIDVNTGKFTGSGGNLEQTVTRNNLEAAEEIVRQLRLRDVGGIVVIDFIDMLLESNRDLVLRRLTECLGRDRTKHQVAEVTSLGLVQMTRKRVGQGLLDAFSEPCPHCDGRGLIVHSEPVDKKTAPTSSKSDNSSSGRKRGRGKNGSNGSGSRSDSHGNGHGDGNGESGDQGPKRDSSAQLSAIAAASAKREENGESHEPDASASNGSQAIDSSTADTRAGTSPTADAPAANTSATDASTEAAAPVATAVATVDPTSAPDAEPAASRVTTRRRRAARRPAGPPKATD